MANFAHRFGPHAPSDTYVAHEYEEHLYDGGEVEINYVTTGDPGRAGAPADPGPDRVVVGL